MVRGNLRAFHQDFLGLNVGLDGLDNLRLHHREHLGNGLQLLRLGELRILILAGEKLDGGLNLGGRDRLR